MQDRIKLNTHYSTENIVYNSSISQTINEDYSDLVSEDQTEKQLNPLNTENMDIKDKLESMVEKIDEIWICKICGRTRKLRANAKQHVETHIDRVSSSCQVCGKVFLSSSGLRKHIYRAHSKESIKYLYFPRTSNSLNNYIFMQHSSF